MTGPVLAQAAASLVGSRFRLHGRNPASGLDCVGLLEAALRLTGRDVSLPTGYSLRHSRPACWLPDPASCGFANVSGAFLPGDAILVQTAVGQVHLAIAGRTAGWVHAHAGLRRVVISPQRPAGPILQHWRLDPQT
jgi:hypothetical protein